MHVDPVVSEINLTHTLAYATPLVLAGLAVGFAFRCGLFNIGGQGQYWVGAYLAVEIGLYVTDHWPGHGREAVLLATIGAARWARPGRRSRGSSRRTAGRTR